MALDLEEDQDQPIEVEVIIVQRVRLCIFLILTSMVKRERVFIEIITTTFAMLVPKYSMVAVVVRIIMVVVLEEVIKPQVEMEELVIQELLRAAPWSILVAVQLALVYITTLATTDYS